MRGWQRRAGFWGRKASTEGAGETVLHPLNKHHIKRISTWQTNLHINSRSASSQQPSGRMTASIRSICHGPIKPIPAIGRTPAASIIRTCSILRNARSAPKSGSVVKSMRSNCSAGPRPGPKTNAAPPEAHVSSDSRNGNFIHISTAIQAVMEGGLVTPPSTNTKTKVSVNERGHPAFGL